ncbi:MAG: ferritin-like domain-containing protein [Candidatus Binatia bacterium]
MDTQKVIQGLNTSLALEYASVIQYYQHSYLLQGTEREYLESYFRSGGKKSLEHAERLGEKIAALGGLPTVEPGVIRQAADVQEMLSQALQLEREAQTAHHDVLLLVVEGKSPEETALRVMLEEMVESEQRDIDELEMLLAKKRLKVTTKEVRLKKSG